MLRDLCDRYELGVRELAQETNNSTTFWSKAWNAQVVPDWAVLDKLIRGLRLLYQDDDSLEADRWRTAWAAAKEQFASFTKVASLVRDQLEKVDLKSPFYPDIVIKGDNVFVQFSESAAGNPDETAVHSEIVSSATTLASFVAKSEGSLKEWAARIESAEAVPPAEESAASVLSRMSRDARTAEAARAIRRHAEVRRKKRVEDLAGRLAGGESISLARERTAVASDYSAIRWEAFFELLKAVGLLGLMVAVALAFLSIVFIVLSQTLPKAVPAQPKDQLETLKISGDKPALRIYPGPPAKSALVFSLQAGRASSTTFNLPEPRLGKTVTAEIWAVTTSVTCKQGSIQWLFRQDQRQISSGRILADRGADDSKMVSLATIRGVARLTLDLRASAPQQGCIYRIYVAGSILI